MLDERKLLEEVEEILELLKSTWQILGITQIIHDMCYSFVLFRQFVLTGESALLQHATQQLKKIAFEGQHTPQERIYMQSLRCSVESGNGCRELTFVQSVLSPIKTWCDNRLRDYHLQFSEGSSSLGGIVTTAILAGKLVAYDLDLTQVVRVSSTAEMAASSKQIEDYIISSIKAAYERALEDVHARSGAEHEHPLMILAENVKDIAKRDSTIFSPVLSCWNARSNAISASLLHSLYGKELKPFLEGVSHLTEDVTSVLPAADILEQYLIEIIYSVYKENGVNGCYKQDICPYQIEAIASPLIARWVNIQLGRILEWVERAIQQEGWEPLSSQQRHGVSIVEIYRIIEETVDQFFNFNLPMRLPQLKSLLTGFDNALQVYSESVLDQLVDKGDLIPPTPILTRYKRDTVVKAFTKKRVMDPGSLAEWNSGQINMLSTARLCVRLNSFYYMVNQLTVLEETIRERWVQLRPSRNSSGGDLKSKHTISNKQVDGFSSSFDGTRKLANEAIDKICDFTGYEDSPGRESPLSPFTGASVTDILKRSASFHWAADGQRSFRLLKQKIQEATMEFKQGGW